jgi:TOMM system kinase/cyclase fusion protein
MTQVLEAVECAHAKGIVHRDLKPSSLMLTGTAPRRNAVVLDFGLGGLAEGLRYQQWQTPTQTRELRAAPLYLAPEQLAGSPATESSDLYAWGLIFLECLTGRHPLVKQGAATRLFTGGTLEIPTWLRSHRLGALLESVTALPVDERDATVEKLIETLDDIARGELPEAPEAAGVAPPLSESGERRHLTVMFCDLVGSSALAQRLDPEDYRRVVQAYQSGAAEAIARYDGHVAQYLGDGLLVYFGHPQAHEDDAERAVRAGMGVLRGLAAVNPRLEAEHGVCLQARVGIHTGPVVVGEMGGREKRETLAVGDTPNVAARLEGFAEPDTVVISDATLRLVSGLFVTEDRGTPALKGISDPIRVYRIVQPSGVTSRLDRAPTLSPFVGREQELELLLECFERARGKRGRAVWIAGEAGIGKSRLVHRLREQLGETPHTWLECRSSPYTQNSALYPLIELVEHALGYDEETSGEEKLEQLERGLAHVGMEPTVTVPLFADLLSLRLPERYAPLEISPPLQRQKTLEALLAWVLALGEKQPLVLMAEDLHWIDPSTLEWLGLLIEQCPTAGLLLLLTFRPEFEPPWPVREHVLPMALRRFEHGEAKDLVAGAIGGVPLPEELVDQIATRSDGVPLFVEELAKGVASLDRDLPGSLSDPEIPETLQDSLMARLDRLGKAKEIAQFGAALGREFPYALIDSIAPATEVALRESLGRLVEAELVYQRGLPPKATYTFRHALVQDTAYQSLLRSQRTEVHGRIVDALEKSFPERVAREPDVVARHCEEAARTAQAIGYYRRAGERATQRSAHAEAIAHLRRAVDLLDTLPESPERNQQELGVRIALGAPLQAAQGMDSPEVEETYARGLSLCRTSDAAPERFQALSGLATFYRNREISRALELGGELLACAEQSGETSQLLFAHSTLAVTLHYAGEFSKARGHEERAIALYDPVEHRSLESVYGLDPGIASLCLASLTLLQLGHPDRALERVEQAIAQAREHTHLHSLAYALNWGAIVHYARGEPRGVLERAEEAIGISMERGLRQQLGGAGIFRAWALCVLAEDGEAGRIIDAVQAGHAVQLLQPVSAPFLGALADAQRRLHRPDDALRTVDAWLAFSAEIQAPYWDAESLRQRGEIRRAQDPAAREEAEGVFIRAIESAKRQAGRFLELRAATSLARLLRDQGRRDEGRALLQPIYDWFTEGFDTTRGRSHRASLRSRCSIASRLAPARCPAHWGAMPQLATFGILARCPAIRGRHSSCMPISGGSRSVHRGRRRCGERRRDAREGVPLRGPVRDPRRARVGQLRAGL